MKTVLIIGRKNGVGLGQDAALVGEALRAAGWTVFHYAPREWRSWLARHSADAVIHLERVFPIWCLKARRNILIPNQERFPKRYLPLLRLVYQVWCKSRHAEEIFLRHHPRVCFVGFTSPDRLLPRLAPDYGLFFHLAGKSTLKGTNALIELWARHPEWPVLTVVQHPSNAPTSVPRNVTLVGNYLSDGELKEMQNTYGIHLCPSRAEGWGHYIVEAMSCRAVTVTTDGPPMNELVQPDRGLLVRVDSSEPRHLGTNYYVDIAALESTINSLSAQSIESKKALGLAARHWFEENADRFARCIPTAIASAVQ